MGGGLSKKGRDQVKLSKTTGGTELNLSDCNVHTIGSFKTIARLKLLRKLDLSANYLQVIPPSIKQLTNLEEFNISYNGVHELPPELSTLASLRVLLLAGNALTGFPDAFGFDRLGALQVLNLGANRISKWPDGFGRLKVTTLDISGNGLLAIPDPVFEIRTLRNLNISDNNGIRLSDKLTRFASLEKLEMCKCSLDELPSIIGSLSNLTYLDASNNTISKLPDELGQLSHLRVLKMEGNHLVDFDNLHMGCWKELEEMLLARNRLDHLPLGFGHMGRLRVLDVSGNVLTALPREVGWLDTTMRKLLVGGNRLEGVPGELSFLNPAIELELGGNNFKPPFLQWYQEGIVTLMENLKPFIKGYPSHCYVYGDGLGKGMAGVPNQFFLQAVDRQGDKRLNGGDEYEAVWRGTDGDGNPISQKGISKDMRDGTYTIFYNHQSAGKFEVHITDHGEGIKDSPFPAYIAPAPADPYKSRVMGQTPTGKVGVPVQFAIHARDKFMNPLDRGGENFQVRVSGPSGAAPKAVIEDTTKGIYNVAWTPGWAGEYSVEITLDGTPLNASPLQVTVA